MGIPSYFSYIIRNYPQIVKNLKFHKKNGTRFHNLFMDCNSIIYDAIRSISDLEDDFESKLIDIVIEKIHKYILEINPLNTIFIAFDGVAPLAKMNQQRTRRYKSDFLSKMEYIKSEKELKWSTSNITPGTKFMDMLSKKISYHFLNTETKYKVKNVIVSGSDEVGEGEHKIFKYIRDHPNIEENMMLYGLDSDLIMLSIFNNSCFRKGFIFREAPEFIKSSIVLDEKPNENEPYVLDISLLCDSILREMNCKYPDKQRVYDYVFLCFLLGNDFLPHFPALNIRTHGIPVLLDMYSDIIGKYHDRFLISKNNKIQWRFFGKFIKELAKNEYQFLLEEYGVRDKHEKRNWKENTPEEREQALQNIPIIYRIEEKYICPSEKMWEERYYKSLFHLEKNQNELNNICTNFLEGMEWVFKYYSGDCPDWRWSYNYHYPPLLSDLQHFIPDFDTTFIRINRKPFTPKVQLAYVLPTSQFDLIIEKNRKHLLKKYSYLYSDKMSFQWAFCRYFWEAHVNFQSIPVEIMEKWENELTSI